MIRFYFDYVSPYAYLAWTRIRSLAERLGQEVEPAPIFFAALLDAWGQKGPAEIPPKREWLFKDVVRRAHAYGRAARPSAGAPSDDSLPQLEAFARGEDTIDRAWLERWRTLPASAARAASIDRKA